MKIIHLKSVDSSNNYAIELAKNGAGHGTVVWADEQTAGRGKLDRIWQSERGKDLLASFIVRPKMETKEASSITLRAAEIIKGELEEMAPSNGGPFTIKPPNDILLAGKKVCGILTESSSTGSRLDYAVIGVGINVNSSPSSKIPGSTSLFEEFGKCFEIKPILEKMAEKIKICF